MQVFLSHSGRDRKVATAIRDRLTPTGVRWYLAEHDPRPGEVLSKKVQAAIEKSDLVVLLLTPNSYDSAYVHQEVGYAIRAGKLVVPLVDRSVPAGALAMLEGAEYIALDNEAPEAALRSLEEFLQRRASTKELEEFLLLLLAVVLLVLVFSPSR